MQNKQPGTETPSTPESCEVRLRRETLGRLNIEGMPGYKKGQLVENQIHRFKIGAFECIAIDDGTNKEYIDALFEGIPGDQLAEASRAQGLEEDKALPCNNLLVKTGEHTVLIDAGQNDGKLRHNLQEAGIAPLILTR